MKMSDRLIENVGIWNFLYCGENGEIVELILLKV